MSRVYWHESLPSTMTEASRLAAEGAAHGTVVAALEQTAGQGRQGREWFSSKGDGLYCTFILRFEVSAADLPCVTLGLGLAVAEALAPMVAAPLDIRWPNDILCHGRKLCGILARLDHGAVLAGIGVNLNQQSFPPELRTPATSLRLLEGRTFAPQQVLALLEAPVRECMQAGREGVLRLFAQASSYVFGRQVQVDLDGTILEGVTDGLDEFGFLRIRKVDGTRETVYAGSVRPTD